MKKLTLTQINKWVKLAKEPLDDQWLEALQQEHFGEFRHEYYRFLYHLVLNTKPKVALEIGVDLGIASVHMCAAAATYGGIVVGIDRRNSALPFVNHYDNYHFVIGDSLESEQDISDICSAYGPLGIVFQDSSHHYNATVAEWEIYRQYLGKNAVWVCDDITENFHNKEVDPPGKGMIQYFEERSGRKKLYPDLHFGSVIGVILT